MSMSMPSLPSGVAPYKKTRRFTAADVPDALLKRHNTKEGTWGKIIVEGGSLRYTIFGDGVVGGGGGGGEQEYILRAGEGPGIIEPQVLFDSAMLGSHAAGASEREVE
jgi:tellurite resistance-related uncharacterized protein